MKFWTIASIAASLALIGLSVVLNRGSQSLIALSTPLFVAGATCAAVCATLWLARSLGLGRRGANSGDESARIRSFMDELVECVDQAGANGVLTLSQRTIRDRQSLFAKGVEMLVSAENPAKIREALTAAAQQEVLAANIQSKRLSLICRVLPVAALTAAFATIIWVLTVAGGVAVLGPLAPIALLAAVYGAYVVTVVAMEVGERASVAAAEKELTGSLVIETIVAIGAGASASRVGSLLGGIMMPSQPAPVGGHAIRQAA